MSSWQTYVGTRLGGAIGGALTPFFEPVTISFITGVSSTVMSMGLSNVTGASNYSLGKILATSLLIDSGSGITAGILDNVKIPTVNSGRGSLSAVYANLIFKKELILGKQSVICATYMIQDK